MVHSCSLLSVLREGAILIQCLIPAISRRAAAERIGPLTRALTGHVVRTAAATECCVMSWDQRRWPSVTSWEIALTIIINFIIVLTHEAAQK